MPQPMLHAISFLVWHAIACENEIGQSFNLK